MCLSTVSLEIPGTRIQYEVGHSMSHVIFLCLEKCSWGPEESLRLQSDCLDCVRSRFTHFITISYCPAEYNLSAVPLSPITLAEMEIIENSYKENTLLYLTKDWLFSDFMIYLSLTNNSWLPIVLAHVVLYIFTHSDSGKAGYSLIMHYCQWMFMLFLCLQGTEQDV